jgi:mannose-6-phosphate isomerase-like protein (cupin superfamily)
MPKIHIARGLVVGTFGRVVTNRVSYFVQRITLPAAKKLEQQDKAAEKQQSHQELTIKLVQPLAVAAALIAHHRAEHWIGQGGRDN